MTGHARLAPSAAHQWVNCAGMVTLAAHYPEDTDGPEAREGKAAHHVAALALGGIEVSEGATVPPGVAVTPEMLEGAALYREHVLECVPLSSVRAEQPVHCALVHPDCYGTPDAWAFGDGVLDVWDYKYGFRFVEVFENWQLLCYAAGVIGDLGIADHVRIRLHIIQPRSFHRDGPIRTWETDSVRFATYLAELQRGALAATDPAARTRAGAWCRNCAAAAGCEALSAAAYDAVSISGSTVPFDLGAAAVGRELQTLRRAEKALSARITGIEQQAIAQIRAGQYVPFWQLQEGRRNLTWNLPDAEVIALGPLLGVDLAKPPAPITPTQARDKLKVDEAVINAYAARPHGELKLVPADISQAKKVFSK